MAKRVHAMPECPHCGHRNSRVVATMREVVGEYDTVRARECKQCTLRFYTGQVNEEVLESIKWSQNGDWVIKETVRLAQ
jgi:transcriptional regulator NrdR family protein